jgi:hypothetical protein
MEVMEQNINTESQWYFLFIYSFFWIHRTIGLHLMSNIFLQTFQAKTSFWVQFRTKPLWLTTSQVSFSSFKKWSSTFLCAWQVPGLQLTLSFIFSNKFKLLYMEYNKWFGGKKFQSFDLIRIKLWRYSNCFCFLKKYLFTHPD